MFPNLVGTQKYIIFLSMALMVTWIFSSVNRLFIFFLTFQPVELFVLFL